MKINVTRNEIFAKLNQEEVMEFYFGSSINFGRKYRNPFREQLGLRPDYTPGCYFKYSEKGVLLFYDPASSKVWFDCIDVAELSTGVKRPEVYNAIWEKIKPSSISSFESFIYSNEKKDIKVELMPFDESDYKYWGQFNISPMILSYFNVRKCKRFWVDDELRGISTDNQPIYRYKEKDKFKIYRPFASKKNKFRNNYANYLEGWKQLPLVGDVLLITSSLKDVMSLYSMGFTSVAATSETRMISKNALKLLRPRFDYIFTYLNNDETGLKMKQKYEDELGIIGFTNSGADKDPSDFIKNCGVNEVYEHVEKFIEISKTNIPIQTSSQEHS